LGAAARAQDTSGRTAVQAAPNAAVTPAPRDQEEWWVKRHEAVLERVRRGGVDLLFVGDSITQGWEKAGEAVWQHHYAGRNAVNLGFSGDRTQHVLWRLDHGEVEGIQPKLAVVMIGTNNSSGDDHSAEQIADGVAAVVAMLRERLPEAHVLLLGIFPRGQKPDAQREKIAEVNHRIAGLADGKKVQFLDIGEKFVNPDGTISPEIMPDYLHLSTRGYEIWADAIEPAVAKLLKP